MLIDEIALAQLGLQDNIQTGIVLMHTHFVCPDPLPDHVILRSLCQHSIFRDVTAVPINVYVFLPTLANGPVPTIANLLANFEIAIFRVVEVSITDITLLRIGVLHDNASAATATANSELTYGNLQTRMYYPIPPGVAGAPAPQFLVAKTALADRLRAQDPHLVVPQAAAPIQPAAPAPPAPDMILQQLVAGQAGIAAASKLTPAKLADYDRIQSMAAFFPPGRFASTIALLMFALPDGQPPSAGYLSFNKVIQAFREYFFNHAQHRPERTPSVTDPQIEYFIKFDFNKVSLAAFATPEESPLATFAAVKLLAVRISDLTAIIFGTPLALAVLAAMNQLCELALFDCPTLTPAEALQLLQRRLFIMNKDKRFDIAVARNDLPLETNFTEYLTFLHTDLDVHRMVVSRVPSELDSSKPAPNPNPKPGKRRRSLAPVVTTAPPASRTTRSVSRADANAILKPWYDDLHKKIPALKNVELPCLHWLSNITPCHQHAACQKTSNPKPHVIDTVVADHMVQILAWLKKDPLDRF